MSIALEYKLTPDDLAEMTMEYQRVARQIIPKRRIWMMRTIPLVAAAFLCAGLFWLFVSANDPSPDSRDRVPNAIFAVLPWAMVILCIPFFIFRKRIRAAFFRRAATRKYAESPNLSQPLRALLSGDGITFQSATANSAIAWSYFLLCSETRNLFLLFSSPKLVQIIPKCAFPSPSDIETFRRFAATHIGVRATGFPVQPPKKDEPNPESAI